MYVRAVRRRHRVLRCPNSSTSTGFVWENHCHCTVPLSTPQRQSQQSVLVPNLECFSESESVCPSSPRLQKCEMLTIKLNPPDVSGDIRCQMLPTALSLHLYHTCAWLGLAPTSSLPSSPKLIPGHTHLWSLLGYENSLACTRGQWYSTTHNTAGACFRVLIVVWFNQIY